MTKKLVKELREAALGGPGEVTLDMLTGAADEIERLQKHNDELLRLSEQRAYRTAKPAMANTLVQRLEALATALEEHSPEDAQTIREAIIALAMPSHEPEVTRCILDCGHDWQRTYQLYAGLVVFCERCNATQPIRYVGPIPAKKSGAVPARPYPGDEEAVRQTEVTLPYCTCVARCDDDPHKAGCKFWEGILAARKSWHDRNVAAWSCSQEAKGRTRCSQWCGHPEFCTATGTDRRELRT